LIALITLSDLAGHPEVLRFEPSHLQALLRRPDDPFNIAKVERAIERFQRLDANRPRLWANDQTVRSPQSIRTAA